MKYTILSILAVICLVPSESKAGVIPTETEPSAVCSKFESVIDTKYGATVIGRGVSGNRYTFISKTEGVRLDFYCEYKVVITYKNKIKDVKVVLHSNDGSWKFERQ